MTISSPPALATVPPRRRRAPVVTAARLTLAALLTIIIAFHSLLWLKQRDMIYPADPTTPSLTRLLPRAEAVSFPTADGLTLHAWYLRPTRPDTSRATALLFHGNGGSRASVAPLATALADAGLTVLAVDYRGYGGNPGQPTEDGLREDARAARAYLLGRPEVDPARLVYIGESLGAAVALALATEQPPAALVLRSPFATLVEVAQPTYWWLPLDLLIYDQWRSIDRIGGIRAPVLVVASDGDRLVPAEQSRRLYERATGLKQLVIISGAGHNDARLARGPEFIGPTLQFIRAATGT